MAEPLSSGSQPMQFDPYHKWLGISPNEQPPNHYRLLGLNVFESDADVIAAAAARQTSFLRQYATGPHSENSQKLLNEVSEAEICLLVPEKKAEYDTALRKQLAADKAQAREAARTSQSSSPVSKPSVASKDGDDSGNSEGGSYSLRDPSLEQEPTPTAARNPTTKGAAPVPMSKADIEFYHRLSVESIDRKDYAQAIEFLQTIPRSQRNSNSSIKKLYEKTVQLDQKSQALNAEMNEAFEREDFVAAVVAARQLLKLKPKHRQANEILRNASRIRPRSGRRRKRQQVLLPLGISPSAVKFAVAALALVVVFWGGMSLIKSIGGSRPAESGSVAFQIDNAFRTAALTLLIDGEEVALATLEGGLTLTTGRHKLEIKKDERVIHTEEIVVDPKNQPIVTLTYADGKIDAAATVTLDTAPLQLPDGNTGEVLVLEGHTADIRDLAFSPNGRYLLSASSDRSARLWNLENGAEVRTFEPGNYVSSVAIASDGQRIAINGDRTNTFHTWDLESGKSLREFSGHTSQVSSVVFSPDGKSIVSASGYQPDGSVRLWDAETGEEKWNYALHRQNAGPVSFSPDGSLVLAVVDGSVMTLSATTGERTKLYDGTGPASFSANGSLLLTKSNTANPAFWNTATGLEYKTLPDVLNVAAFTFSTTGPFAAFSTNNRDDSSITVWNVVKGEKVATFEGHEGTVNCLTFSPDGRFLASGSRDKNIRLWRLPKEVSNSSTGFETLAVVPSPLPEGPEGEVRHIIGAGVNPDVSTTGNLVATTYGGYAKAWDINTGELVFKSLGHNASVAVISPDGRYVLSAGNSKVHLWETATGRELQRLPVPGTLITGLSLPNDYRHVLVTTRLDKDLESTVAILFDLQTGRELQRFPKLGSQGLQQAAISPNGQQVASVDFTSQTARLFNATNGETLYTLPLVETETPATAFSLNVRMRFSPDGSRLVTIGPERTVRLWDVETGTLVKSAEFPSTVAGLDVSPQADSILTCAAGVRMYSSSNNRISELFGEEARSLQSIRFVPDGKYAVSSASDGALKVWRLPEVEWSEAESPPVSATFELPATTDSIRTFQAHKGEVRRLLYSPDGQTLASVSPYDTQVRVWDVFSRRDLHTFQPAGSPAGGVAFGRGGQSLITGQNSGTIIDWDISTENKTIWSQGHAKAISDMATSPDGRLLATISPQDDGTLRMWDIDKGEELWRFALLKQRASSLAFVPDGTKLLAEIDGLVMLFDASTGLRLRLFDGTGPAALSPDGSSVVTSGPEMLRLWSTETGHELQRYRGYAASATSLAFSHDGRFLVTNRSDQPALQVWDVAGGRPLMLHQISNDELVTAVAFSPREDQLAYGTKSGLIGFWKLPELSVNETEPLADVAAPGTITTSASTATPGEVARLSLPGYYPTAMEVSGDGRFVAAIHNFVAKVWDLQSGELIFSSMADRNRLEGIAIAHDGAFLLTRTPVGVDRWNLSNGIRRLFIAEKDPIGLTLAPDGAQALIFIASGNKTQPAVAALYDIATGKRLAQLACDSPGRTPRAVFSPDGQQVAVVDGAMVRLFDAAGVQQRLLIGHEKEIVGMPVYSDDGTRLFTYAGDRTVKQWNTSTGQGVSSSDVRLQSITLGSDGTFLSIMPAGLTRFRTANAMELSHIDARISRNTILAFVPGGEFAVSASDDNTLRLWRLPAP